LPFDKLGEGGPAGLFVLGRLPYLERNGPAVNSPLVHNDDNIPEELWGAGAGATENDDVALVILGQWIGSFSLLPRLDFTLTDESSQESLKSYAAVSESHGNAKSRPRIP